MSSLFNAAGVRRCRPIRRSPYEDRSAWSARLPGGKTLYEEMLRYIDVAEEALQMARAPSEFRARMIDRFPDYGGLKVLDHQLRFLFPEAANA